MPCAVAGPSAKPELTIAKNIIYIICLFSSNLIGVHTMKRLPGPSVVDGPLFSSVGYVGTDAVCLAGR